MSTSATANVRMRTMKMLNTDYQIEEIKDKSMKFGGVCFGIGDVLNLIT